MHKGIIMRIEAAISAALAGFSVWPLWAFLTIQQGDRHGGVFLMLLVLLLWLGSAAFALAALTLRLKNSWAWIGQCVPGVLILRVLCTFR